MKWITKGSHYSITCHRLIDKTISIIKLNSNTVYNFMGNKKQHKNSLYMVNDFEKFNSGVLILGSFVFVYY